jgi:hypothetical protein
MTWARLDPDRSDVEDYRLGPLASSEAGRLLILEGGAPGGPPGPRLRGGAPRAGPQAHIWALRGLQGPPGAYIPGLIQVIYRRIGGSC